jgi:hypothetical protein
MNQGMLRMLAEQAVDSILASPGPRPPCPCEESAVVGLGDLDEYDDEYDVIVAAGSMPGKLTAYWSRGEGAAKIGWGTDGAFDRCVSQMSAHNVPNPKGTCANLERNATGHWPADKAVQSAPRTFPQEKRDQFADRGIAMDDGSYPIPDKDALQRAIQSYGRAKDPAAVKRHIMKRARALGATDLLPDDWTSS